MQINKDEWLANRDMALLEAKNNKIILKCMPCFIKMEINKSCNCKCFFCGSTNYHSAEKLTFEEIDALSSFTKYAVHIQTTFCAEPFTTPDEFCYLLKKIRECNEFATISTISNGILMNGKIIDNLLSYSTSKIRISINADNDEKYLEYNKNGSLTNVLKNIDLLNEKKYLKNLKYPELCFNHILSRFADPFKIVDIAKSKCVTDILFILVSFNALSNEKRLHCSQNDGWNYLSKLIIDLNDCCSLNKINSKFWYWGDELEIPPNLLCFFGMLSPEQSSSIMRFDFSANGCPNMAPWLHLNTRMRDVMHCLCSGVVTNSWGGKQIGEIWNGEYMQFLRKSISESNFPGSCNCKKFKKIIKENQIIIKKGDSLCSLFGEKWEQIYDLPSNTCFRKLNPDPNLIFPGSIINTI